MCLVGIIILIHTQYRIVRLGILRFLAVLMHKLVQIGSLTHQQQAQAQVVLVLQTHYGHLNQRLHMIRPIRVQSVITLETTLIKRLFLG